MYTGLESKSSNCETQFILMATEYWHPAKYKLTSSQAWLLANGWEGMNTILKSR